MLATRAAATLRAVRIHLGLRQVDVARRAGVSQATVSRLERGRLDAVPLAQVAEVADVLGVRLDLVPRWRGGDLDRLLNARHAALHQATAGWFVQRWPGWELAPEVSFSVYGERGVVDLFAWFPEQRALLVVELKTELVDLNELVGTLDRKRRLAREIVQDRGWQPDVVGGWVVVSASRATRRHVAQHAAFLRAALPDDGSTGRRWLTKPDRALKALSLERLGASTAAGVAVRRVRAGKAGRGR